MTKQIGERLHDRLPMTVPFMELKDEHRALREELRRVWDEALDSGAFVGGSGVERFERAFAEFCEVTCAVGVGNGSDALVLALRALGVGNGHEVITAANSFVATAEAIVHVGATPVFVDIDPKTYNIDVHRIEDCITARTKAIIPVHLYGQPADMYPVLEIARLHGLIVIEDAAQAHGARYHGRRAGSMGDAACFSFYPAKNLGACGDGGAVVTNDLKVADAVRMLRDHGSPRKYEHGVIGYNSRLDSLQAAVLQIKLQHLESVYHLYVVRIEKGSRNGLQEYLKNYGVQTGIHYPTPIHRTPAFASFNAGGCPVAEKYAEQILSLPMYPEMKRNQMQYIADLLTDYMQVQV